MIRSRRSSNLLVSALLLAGAAAVFSSACADVETAETEPTPPACVPKDGPLPHESLSDYCLFEGPLADMAPAEGVYHYEVAAALWSDHAAKQRLIALPKGEKITFDEGEEWVFPKGTILAKTFSFYDDFRDQSTGHRIIETRLLILGDDGWTGHVYRWNDEQTEATRMIAGEKVQVDWIDEAGEPYSGTYIVPNTNQCKNCHERDDQTTFLGPFTHQLNRDVEVDGKVVNQLEDMASHGLFDADLPDVTALPAFPDPFGDAPVEQRARAWLHANCSHCHRPGGGGGPSGLVLLEWEHTPAKNGICKEPAAAGPGTGGLDWDIEPGNPDESILVYRISSTDPEIKMPELPNRIPDHRAIEVIREWISGMEPDDCL